MKELSIEEKAKAYDELKVKASRIYHKENDVLIMHIIEDLFPELKESEDERIRKNLIGYIKGISKNEVCEETKDSWIAWLEKQGEQKPVEKIESKFKVGDIIKLKDCDGLEWTVEEVLNNGYYTIVCADRDDFIQLDDKWHLVEHKPADKAEPKFKVGDWITDGEKVWKIGYIEDDMYIEHRGTISGGGAIESIDKHYHLWTIQDAKDGNVLFMDNGTSNCIFIYKSFNNGIINKYASYNKFGFEGEHYLVLNDGYVIPATNEQRDLLFQKMKEAGYWWDAEKKELRKIEQKHTEWSEEDEKILNSLISSLARIGASTRTDSTSINYTFSKEIDWLKSLKDRIQPKFEWNKEDEDILNTIINHFEIDLKCTENDDIIRWLKSLRPQSQWKPSDEQMLAINTAINVLGKGTLNGKQLIELREELQKLREG